MVIAPGAERILDLRRRGGRPADMVVVSLVGPAGVENFQVSAAPGVKYDWRWAAGLEIALFINSRIEWRNTAFDLKASGTKYLVLWDVGSRRGAEVLWRPGIQAAGALQQSVVRHGFVWTLDFINFHEEDNKAFINENHS